MTSREVETIEKYASLGNNYFEYGCGRSTVIVSNMPTIKYMVSVDSSYEWIAKTADLVNYKDKEIIFNYINIGSDDKNWGYPKDKTLQYHWTTYHSSINHYKEIFDTILIDGRFRVACCIKSYQNMDEKSRIMIHDYTHRPAYNYIEKFFEKVETVDSLCVFKKNMKKAPTTQDIIEYNLVLT